MRILIANTYHKTGGAAIAALRLHDALSKAGVEATLLTSEGVRFSDGSFVAHPAWRRKLAKWIFYAGKIWITVSKVSTIYRFAYSEWNVGLGIRGWIKRLKPDIVHLHWINDYFVGKNDFNFLAEHSIPVVWTLHDMWPFTGGCHYSGACSRFTQGCGQCYMLQKPTDLDASSILWEQKKIQYARLHLSVVGCSKWISDLAVASGLLSGAKVLSIPNPIDTTRFTPKEKFALRKSKGIAEDAFVVLFGAMSLKDKRKGFHLLQASLQHLKQTRPDIDPLLVVIGKSEPQLTELLPYRIHYGGMVQEEEIADWYALSDVMALSSMQDNLPNTVMEALACGVPVVAYAIGGIPEMIRHGFNGMLVPAFDTQEFAKALAKLIDSDRTAMEVSARAWVMEHYSYSTVVASYQQVYASSMTARS